MQSTCLTAFEKSCVSTGENLKHFFPELEEAPHHDTLKRLLAELDINELENIHLDVVECQERWYEIKKVSSLKIEKSSRHVWISSVPLTRWNLHERCNLGARSRWVIETAFLVEKRQGYQYEHCFSYDWNATKGYHCLMQLGHMSNVMAQYSGELAKILKDTGLRGLIRLVRESIASPWIDATWVREKLAAPFQLRLT